MPTAHLLRRGPTRRAAACEAECFFRVVVVVVSSVVRLGSSGTTPNAQPSRISGTRFRALTKHDLKRSRSPLLITRLVAFVHVDGAERRSETCGHFRWLGSSRTTLGWAINQPGFERGIPRLPLLHCHHHTPHSDSTIREPAFFLPQVAGADQQQIPRIEVNSIHLLFCISGRSRHVAPAK